MQTVTRLPKFVYQVIYINGK